MLCLSLESSDPYFNLATEEVLLKNKSEEYLILGINSSSVIIGKHQVAHREINTRFVTENKIPVIRRISGGGAVFHDRGNLNFSFISRSEAGRQIDFRKYTKPVIDFLSSIGIGAKFEGKNDIKNDGLKISGNAEHVHRDRVLHHGTLLFSASLDRLSNSLRRDKSCYISRAVPSNPSHVTNLKDTTGFKDIYEFKSAMLHYFLENLPDLKIYQLSSDEITEVNSLANSKYKSWEWNWAYGPEYQFINQFDLDGKGISCNLSVNDGIITGCKIEGSQELTSACNKLTGCRHMVEDMQEVFKKEDMNITENEIFNFF